MNRNTSSLIATGVLLAAMTATGVALAHDGYPGPRAPGPEYGWFGYDRPHHGPRGHHGMSGLSYLAEELDLSTEQRKTIRDIMDKSRSQARELGESMVENREQMDEVLDDKGYGADFDKLARRQGELIGEMIMLRAKTRARIEGALTEEQRERFRDYAGDSCERGPGYGWRGHGW
ncbi:MAG: Spy/CpxP family protein refolding chaperone [Gammaproteobacteria bacterium]